MHELFHLSQVSLGYRQWHLLMECTAGAEQRSTPCVLRCLLKVLVCSSLLSSSCEALGDYKWKNLWFVSMSIPWRQGLNFTWQSKCQNVPWNQGENLGWEGIAQLEMWKWGRWKKWEEQWGKQDKILSAFNPASFFTVFFTALSISKHEFPEQLCPPSAFWGVTCAQTERCTKVLLPLEGFRCQ